MIKHLHNMTNEVKDMTCKTVAGTYTVCGTPGIHKSSWVLPLIHNTHTDCVYTLQSVPSCFDIHSTQLLRLKRVVQFHILVSSFLNDLYFNTI